MNFSHVAEHSTQLWLLSNSRLCEFAQLIDGLSMNFVLLWLIYSMERSCLITELTISQGLGQMPQDKYFSLIFSMICLYIGHAKMLPSVHVFMYSRYYFLAIKPQHGPMLVTLKHSHVYIFYVRNPVVSISQIHTVHDIFVNSI